MSTMPSLVGRVSQALPGRVTDTQDSGGPLLPVRSPAVMDRWSA
jgi:hypothetical protein